MPTSQPIVAPVATVNPNRWQHDRMFFYDRIRRRRIHMVYVWGTVLIMRIG
jgi:hypothetical protein